MIKKIITILIITTSICLFMDMLHIYYKYKPIESVLREMSLMEYTDNYKCIQFSEDTVKKLKEKGIQASMISGRTKDGPHRWIAIEFESQTGRILKPDNYETLLLSKNK